MASRGPSVTVRWRVGGRRRHWTAVRCRFLAVGVFHGLAGRRRELAQIRPPRRPVRLRSGSAVTSRPARTLHQPKSEALLVPYTTLGARARAKLATQPQQCQLHPQLLRIGALASRTAPTQSLPSRGAAHRALQLHRANQARTKLERRGASTDLVGHRNAVALTTILRRATKRRASKQMSDSRVDVEQPSSWEVRWKGLTFKVPDKTNGQKTILDDCSGAVRGGQVCGVLGPSGSGKTTLLDALAGRIDGARKGRISRETSRAASAARTFSKEEALVGVLTTKETLHTAAALVGGAAARQRADALLDELGLTSCADVIVGTILLKGLGGQKRRLSIAVELVAEPKTLLLDEPTSGLDSASALAVLEKVKAVAASSAVAVVLTLHQPSHAAWQTLDRVSFMARGRVCYFGDDAGLKAFLATADSPVPANRDVAEYVLSLTNEDFPGHGDVDAIVAKFRETRDDSEAVDRSTGAAAPRLVS